MRVRQQVSSLWMHSNVLPVIRIEFIYIFMREVSHLMYFFSLLNKKKRTISLSNYHKDFVTLHDGGIIDITKLITSFFQFSQFFYYCSITSSQFHQI